MIRWHALRCDALPTTIRVDRMRGEMMGLLGELLGISPEQMEELRSEDGQRRLHEGMKRFEGEVQDAIEKMMGGQGDRRVVRCRIRR